MSLARLPPMSRARAEDSSRRLTLARTARAVSTSTSWCWEVGGELGAMMWIEARKDEKERNGKYAGVDEKGRNLDSA